MFGTEFSILDEARKNGCHGPNSQNGPHAPTKEAHTHHAAGSAGSECVACHMPKIEQTIADVNVRAPETYSMSVADLRQGVCHLRHPAGIDLGVVRRITAFGEADARQTSRHQSHNIAAPADHSRIE